MLFLDTELIRLTQKYQKLEVRYDEVSDEIDSLQGEFKDLENSMERLESQIKSLKETLLKQKVSAINVFTDDRFTNDFIRASYFAAKDEFRSVFQHVNITECEIQASDTHRLIIITCPCIPEKLKNTMIKWDVRENFAEHITKGLSFPYARGVIPEKEGYVLFSGVIPKDFYKQFKPVASSGGEFLEIDFAGVRVVVRKEYLDEALLCVGGTFDLYVKGKHDALMLETENTMAMVLPVRYG